MRRVAAWMATAAVAITAAVVVAAPAATSSPRGDAWRARAATAVSKARAIDTGADTAMTYAHLAGATGRLYGWSHAWTTDYLSRVYARQQPDGGYGLGKAWDAFQDGSTNPSDATYTVTLAGHVGPTLLDGYRAGVVPRAKVQQIIDLLMAMPRIDVARGQCVAYSDQPADVQPGYCVHNVNSGVALFLHNAAAAGFGATGMHRLLADITIHEQLSYREATTWWPYMGDGPDQDPDHNSYSAEALYRLGYWPGREAAYQMMVRTWPDDPLSTIAHMRLTGLPGGVASWDRYSPTTPLWCTLGDARTADVDAFIASPPSPAMSRLAQAAYYSALAWVNCP